MPSFNSVFESLAVLIFIKSLITCGDPEGGGGAVGLDPPPPEKFQKYRVS